MHNLITLSHARAGRASPWDQSVCDADFWTVRPGERRALARRKPVFGENQGGWWYHSESQVASHEIKLNPEMVEMKRRWQQRPAKHYHIG